MNRTASDHPLVASYLRDLDEALRLVPVGRAQELREQITAHLDDALPPGAGDQEVTEILDRLGRPADLAAEAIAAAGKRPWPARLGWRAWALIAAAAVVTGAVASYLAVMLSAAPIETAGDDGWWYAQDSSQAVRSSADGAEQTTVPVRPGQQQGFTALLYNLPGPIGPHQYRLMRVLWTSRGDCLSAGASSGIDHLALLVRVGLLTRTEDAPLDQAWALSGRG